MTEHTRFNIELWKKEVLARKPLVHHLTNLVTLNDCANITIAAGGIPIMGDTIDEVEEITHQAQALVLNLGTPSQQKVTAMIKAGKVARALKKPMVFDPVGVGVSTARMRWAEKILAEVKPTIIKANNGELAALANIAGYSCGVDALEGYELPFAELKKLQVRLNAVIVATGATSRVIDQAECFRVSHGDPYSTRITGSGCMLNSMIALFAAVTSPLAAAIGGLAVFGKAAEDAASSLDGPYQPGTYKARFFDEIAQRMHTQSSQGWKVEFMGRTKP